MLSLKGLTITALFQLQPEIFQRHLNVAFQNHECSPKNQDQPIFRKCLTFEQYLHIPDCLNRFIALQKQFPSLSLEAREEKVGSRVAVKCLTRWLP